MKRGIFVFSKWLGFIFESIVLFILKGAYDFVVGLLHLIVDIVKFPSRLNNAIDFAETMAKQLDDSQKED